LSEFVFSTPQTIAAHLVICNHLCCYSFQILKNLQRIVKNFCSKRSEVRSSFADLLLTQKLKHPEAYNWKQKSP
jgi:hypothetical protein